MAINYKQCPNCNSRNVVNIIYGLPTHEAMKDAEAGKFMLGGCCVEMDSPDYHCNSCGNEWTKNEAIDRAYEKINRVIATVGGYFGPSYHVEIDLEAEEVSWSKSEGEGIWQPPITKPITDAEAKTFMFNLQWADLLNWKKEYPNPGVMDGTHWQVELVREGRNIKKHGDNNYPEGWDMFCTTIKELTGREFS
ncbi:MULTISPECIES: hypothetical protein [Bacillaceae]|uniref:Uncharacterized protein n=1 Tax=Evansella alkalicola TaxID=745819 RepID=A0ABS6JW12_9BACI|nr:MULTISPECIES: hypothetical protein [Bacillaceae]MBU9722783.1 hypothetical protein [Bacillus alkalicola]